MGIRQLAVISRCLILLSALVGFFCYASLQLAESHALLARGRHSLAAA